MQSTIERGDSFRDAVVALLEAAEIRCVAEVRSEFKKVDIVARTESDIDGSLTVLIEAKDYRGALPKDKCVEFVVEYGTLVNGRHDHRAWLVSRGPIAPDGRSLVEAAGHKCFTVEELQRRLFRINSYLLELIAGFERKRIAEYYIPPCTTLNEELDHIIAEWIRDGGAEPIAIMGGYGIGKTTFATHFAAALARVALEACKRRCSGPIRRRGTSLDLRYTSVQLAGVTGRWAVNHIASSGRIFLANMPERRLKQFLATGPWQQITPYTITDPQVLTGELKRIREQDYAVNDSEFIVGVVGAAVPVRSEDDRVLAAVTVSAPKIRLTPDRVKDCIPAMGWTAARIARAF